MIVDPISLTITGIVITVLIGAPALYYQRRQTHLAQKSLEASARTEAQKSIDVLRRIRETKRARVGVLHYPPFVSILGDEEATGLYIDLIRELCTSESIAPIFVPLRFSSAVNAVRDHQVDMALSIFQTPRRSRTVDFCAFMHSVSVSGVVRRTEDRITSQSDLLQIPCSSSCAGRRLAMSCSRTSSSCLSPE
jgi:ABC-type amino acid transport substrate-binding protein